MTCCLKITSDKTMEPNLKIAQRFKSLMHIEETTYRQSNQPDTKGAVEAGGRPR